MLQLKQLYFCNHWQPFIYKQKHYLVSEPNRNSRVSQVATLSNLYGLKNEAKNTPRVSTNAMCAKYCANWIRSFQVYEAPYERALIYVLYKLDICFSLNLSRLPNIRRSFVRLHGTVIAAAAAAAVTSGGGVRNGDRKI